MGRTDTESGAGAAHPDGHSPLEARLVARIGREGLVSYESFVETVLYDAEHGYYKSGKRDRADYVTSPEIHALFGRTVGRYIEGTCDRCGAASVTIIELGGATGRMAEDILSAFTHVVPDAYIIVEKGEREDIRPHPMGQLPRRPRTCPRLHLRSG
jgi:SAM-dependent MidA family methyltransferase